MKHWNRRTSAYRLLLLALVLAGGYGLMRLDQAGLFGRYSRGDMETYNGRTFRVVHVVDGDTIDIDCPDKKSLHTRIRLWGVDTPETVKPEHPVEHFGPEASSFTKNVTLDKDVRLELLPHSTRDKYGRLLAYVYLPDGKMFNAMLIEKGYAYADPRFAHPHKLEFKQKMQQAKKDRIGLWKDPHPDDLPHYLKSKR